MKEKRPRKIKRRKTTVKENSKKKKKKIKTLANELFLFGIKMVDFESDMLNKIHTTQGLTKVEFLSRFCTCPGLRPVFLVFIVLRQIMSTEQKGGKFSCLTSRR